MTSREREDLIETLLWVCNGWTREAFDAMDDVKKEHMNVLDERLTSVVKDWMKEFRYEPHFWGVANVERISVF